MKRVVEIGMLIVSLYLLVAYAIPSAIKLIRNPYPWSANPFDLSKYAINLFFVIGLLLSVKGIINMIRTRSWAIPTEFSYLFMIWILYSAIQIGTPLIFGSTEYPQIRAHLFSNPLLFLLFLVPLAFIIAHFATQTAQAPQQEEVAAKAISKNKRLLNWILDVVHFLAFAFLGMKTLIEIRADILELSFLKNSVALPNGIMMMVYYFTLETIFMRTPGKIASRSYVMIPQGKNRIWVILLRTVCRLIPLDAFSFLGEKEGWHDSLSNTKVIAIAWEEQTVEQKNSLLQD
jgi:hypothetical protein